jgi:hypothetical protein
MSASLAEGREHGGHVLPTPLNTRELRCIVLAMCSRGRERMQLNPAGLGARCG